MSKQICSNCGKSIPLKNSFCGSCGSNINTKNNTDSSYIDVKSKNGSQNPEKAKVDKNGKVILGITFGFIALIMVAALGSRADLSSSSTQSDTEITENSSQTNQNTTQVQTSILDEDAYKFVNTGEALVTLRNIWGISLSSSDGYISLRDLADYSFDYLQSTVSGNITKENIRVGFEPGNSLYSFFSRHLNDSDAFSAVQERMLDLAE